MAYKKLSDVDIDSVFDHILVTSGGVVKQVSDADINSHYNIDKIKAKANGIVQTVQGENIFVSDSSDDYLRGLSVYGKSMQNSTPAPETPVDIVSVGDNGSVEVAVYGKNLVSMDSFTTMQSNNSGAANTYDPSTHTITLTEDPPYNNSYSGVYCSPFRNLKIGMKYTVSFDIRGTSGKTIQAGWDTARTSITLTSTFNRYKSTVVATKSSEAVTFYTTTSNALVTGEYMQFANVQIELGDTATEYEEYRDAQSLIVNTPNSLPGIPVDEGGNYTDQNGQQWVCNEIDLERGVYIKRINVINNLAEYAFENCKGSDNTTYSSDILRFDFADIFGCKINTSLFCNRFENIYAHDPDNQATARASECISSHSMSDMISIFINKNRLTSLDTAGLRAYLETNNTTLTYILTTPVETELSEDDIKAYKELRSNYPNTTIMNESNVYMSVQYNADTKTYIDNKFEELKALITA